MLPAFTTLAFSKKVVARRGTESSPISHLLTCQKYPTIFTRLKTTPLIGIVLLSISLILNMLRRMWPSSMMKMGMLILIQQFDQVFWPIIRGISIQMVNNFSWFNWVIRMTGIPNDMRPKYFTYTNMSIITKPTAFIIQIIFAFPSYFGSYLQSHSTGCFIRTWSGTKTWRWAMFCPKTSENNITNGTLLSSFHITNITWIKNPRQGGQ